MPRYGEVLVRPTPQLDDFLRGGVDDAITELCTALNRFDPPPFRTIPELLTEEALEKLNDLPVPENGKCEEEVLLAHPVGGPLALTMGKISLSNMDMRSESSRTAYSLRNETGENLVLDAHRDLLDGHAVLFNYSVAGNWFYVLDGVRYKIRENELIVLNGAAEWGDITDFLPGHDEEDPFNGFRHLGGVTMTHAVIGEGLTSRNRLLVYGDGRETTTTQIPPQLPPWF